MRWRLSLLAACTLTAACGGGEEPASLGPVARYDLGGDASPGWLEVPFPSDLYRDPDGTIRVPPLGDVAAAWQDAREVLESRRGFCLTCASLIPVTGAIDRASVTGASAPAATATAADSVVLVDVDPSSPQRGRFIPVQSEINPDDAVVAVRPSPGAILAPSTRYALALTDGVRGVDGAPLQAAETFRARRDGQSPDAGDGLGAALDVLAEVGVARERVMSASVFTTDDPSTHVQAIADLEAQRFADGGPTAAFERLWRADDGSLDALMGTPPADRPGLDNAGGGDDARGVRHATLRFLLAGSFNSPRLLGGEGTEIGDFRRDATGALTLGPVDEKVPFLLSIPEGADVTDLPLAIIHWGIGGRRYNAMAFADTLGAQGIAVLGIDAFQHGARAASATDEIHDFRSNDPALGPDGIAEHENLSILTRMLGLGGTPPPESSPRWALATLSQLILDARAAARFAQQGDLSALAAADPALAGLRFGEIVFLGESLGNIPGTALATMDSGIGAFAFEGSPGATGDVLCTGPMFRSAIDLIFVPLLGLDDDFDEVNRKLCMHPLLQLFRWGLEPTEPVVLASRLFEDRYAGPPPDVLWQSSARDEVVAFVGPERFYGVLGIPAHGPYALIDPPALELPARANFDTPQGPVTAGTYRFEEAGHGMIGSIRQDSAYAFPVIPPFERRPQVLSFENPIELTHGQIRDFFVSYLETGRATIDVPRP